MGAAIHANRWTPGRFALKLVQALLAFAMTTALPVLRPPSVQAETAESESIGRWTLIALPRNLGYIAWIPADSSAATQYCREVYLKRENWGFFSSEFLTLVRRNPVACLAIFCRLSEGHAAELGIELKLVGKTQWLRE